MDAMDYVASETERQSGTLKEAIGMYRAWEFACTWRKSGVGYSHEFIQMLCYLINGVSGYRSVPAVFNQGMPAVPASVVPHAMDVLIDAMNTNALRGLRSPASDYTEEFLKIHPFTDGNGRVGSLLWNMMCSNIQYPEPMPYFFGEN